MKDRGILTGENTTLREKEHDEKTDTFDYAFYHNNKISPCHIAIKSNQLYVYIRFYTILKDGTEIGTEFMKIRSNLLYETHADNELLMDNIAAVAYAIYSTTNKNDTLQIKGITSYRNILDRIVNLMNKLYGPVTAECKSVGKVLEITLRSNNGIRLDISNYGAWIIPDQKYAVKTRHARYTGEMYSSYINLICEFLELNDSIACKASAEEK
jgi:hypothetical protein